MTEKTVQELVTEQLGAIGSEVKAAVVKTMVAREVEKKKGVLVQALDLQKTLDTEFKRLKPDMEFFDEAGTPSAPYYTKVKNEERTKNKELREKLQRAIEKALSKGDYGDLNNIINNNKAKLQPKSGATDEGDTEGTV